MAKQKPQTRTVYRSADDGQFVPKKEAEKKPKEHVKEKIIIPTKKKK